MTFKLSQEEMDKYPDLQKIIDKVDNILNDDEIQYVADVIVISSRENHGRTLTQSQRDEILALKLWCGAGRGETKNLIRIYKIVSKPFVDMINSIKEIEEKWYDNP